MLDRNDAQRRPSILVGTLKIALAVGFLSLCAANWVASGFDTHGLSRLASAVTRDVPDPVSTGSLGRAAGSTVLDPCTVPRGR